MKNLIYLLFILISQQILAQNYIDSVLSIRDNQLHELTDSAEDVLNKEERLHFQGLDFFPVDTAFRIQAVFIQDIGKKFNMPTTTERKPVYRRYGYVIFSIDNQKYRLTVYQNMELKGQKEYKDYLFIPFRDATNEKQTYGGGRFLDAKLPSGATMLIDFNLAYNPYCAYSERYSCPIPPEENTLPVAIEAGEKLPPGHD